MEILKRHEPDPLRQACLSPLIQEGGCLLRQGHPKEQAMNHYLIPSGNVPSMERPIQIAAFDAVIFDLDGTLIDSEHWHKRAEIETFLALGFRVEEHDLTPFVGTTLPDMLKGIAPEITVDTFLEVEVPILAGYIRQEMEMFSDAIGLARRIQSRRALATSSMAWYVAEVLARFDELAELFPVRLCQADVLNGKPDPEIFLKACALLGVSPCRALVVEDSRNGVLGARAAGCAVVGIDRTGLLDLSEADAVLTSLDAL